MAIDKAKYVVTTPGATGPAAVARAFENQVAYCRDNRAGVTALVCQAVGDLLDTDRGGAFMRRVRRWAGPPLPDALPLRVAGDCTPCTRAGKSRACRRSTKDWARTMPPNSSLRRSNGTKPS